MANKNNQPLPIYSSELKLESKY